MCFDWARTLRDVSLIVVEREFFALGQLGSKFDAGITCPERSSRSWEESKFTI